MLKKTMTYEDYNGVTRTEDFYFNLTQAELTELELSKKEGFAETIKTIIDSQDGTQIVETFKKIVLSAYGVKSEDGRRFIKSDELRDEFSQTEAYSDLFVELATDGEAAAAFVNGVVPSKLAEKMQTVNTTELPTAPPVVETKEERSDEELLKMKPQDMTREELQRAFALKNKQ